MELSLLCDSSFPPWWCFSWFLPQPPSPSIHLLGKPIHWLPYSFVEQGMFKPNNVMDIYIQTFPRHLKFKILQIKTFLCPQTSHFLCPLYFRIQHRIPPWVQDTLMLPLLAILVTNISPGFFLPQYWTPCIKFSFPLSPACFFKLKTNTWLYVIFFIATLLRHDWDTKHYTFMYTTRWVWR